MENILENCGQAHQFKDKKALGRVMPVLSVTIMVIALVLQGLDFWARDAVTPNLPLQFLFSDWVWLVTLCSVAFYWRYPWVTLICSWGLFLTVTVVLWRFYFPHTMLLLSSAATLNLLFAHLGVHFRKTKGPALPSTSSSDPRAL